MTVPAPLALSALTMAVVLAGCAAPGAGPGAVPGPVAETPAPQLTPAQAPGVEPCQGLIAPGGRNPSAPGLPDVEFSCLTGGPPVALRALGGRPTVVNLWATWCGPCREEMPVLDEGHDRWGERIRFVGVNTKDDPSAAASFLSEVGVTYPQLVDLDGRLLEHTRVPGLPVTLILDRHGQVTTQHVGPLTDEGLARLLEVALLDE